MPVLSLSSRVWSKGARRQFSCGHSGRLRRIDDALDDYHRHAAVDRSSEATGKALDALPDAIDDPAARIGTKRNVNIDRGRDDKGLVTRLRAEVDQVGLAIAATSAGKGRKATALPDRSVQQAKASDVTRGAQYTKNATGAFETKIYGQEKTNSCACTFSGYLAEQNLREDVFLSARNRINGVVHDFETNGAFLPPIARTLQSLAVDAAHVPTADWPALMKGAPTAPVMLGVYWAGGGGQAILCKGPVTVTWTGDLGHSQNAAGFGIEDTWPSHTGAMMFDDGEYWAWDTAGAAWSHGSAASNAGCIHGKRSLGLHEPRLTRQGVREMRRASPPAARRVATEARRDRRRHAADGGAHAPISRQRRPSLCISISASSGPELPAS